MDFTPTPLSTRCKNVAAHRCRPPSLLVQTSPCLPTPTLTHLLLTHPTLARNLLTYSAFRPDYLDLMLTLLTCVYFLPLFLRPVPPKVPFPAALSRSSFSAFSSCHVNEQRHVCWCMMQKRQVLQC